MSERRNRKIQKLHEQEAALDPSLHHSGITVALVGRPNVGKSTMFNRLAQKALAIVQDMPGLTRDRHSAQVSLDGRGLTLVDTGGLEPKAKSGMSAAVLKQTEAGIAEADVVVMMVDGRVGLTPDDQGIAVKLRKINKPVIVCVNKIDSGDDEAIMAEFHRLGFDEVVWTSAVHGRNIRALIAAIHRFLPKEDAKSPAEKILCRVAVLGRPNVGKSSLINRLLGSERHITSDEAGTTRDAVDSVVRYEGDNFCFIDTAGIRRKARVSEQLEEQMVGSSIRAMERADVVVLLLDATELATDQEAKLAALVIDRGKSLIVAVNKWDARSPELNPQNFREELLKNYGFLAAARLMYLSAKTGQGTEELYGEIKETFEEWQRRIPTGELNRFLEVTLERNPPPMLGGKRGKVYYVSQVAIKPPTMALMVNDPNRFPDSYKRYITNALRETFGFSGSPVVMHFRATHGQGGSAKNLSERKKTPAVAKPHVSVAPGAKSGSKSGAELGGKKVEPKRKPRRTTGDVDRRGKVGGAANRKRKKENKR